MSLTKLHEVSVNAKKASEYGVTSTWCNEILLDLKPFIEVVSENNIEVEGQLLANGRIQISFEHEGFFYFNTVSKQQYSSLILYFDKEKMTS